jgi:subtilisin family serine protease
MATFEQLSKSGIRGIVLTNIEGWPDVQGNQARALLAATGPAQQAIDTHMTGLNIPPGDIADQLDSWASAWAVVAAAVREAATLVAQNPGITEVSVDSLTVTHEKRMFPEPTKEVPHAR